MTDQASSIIILFWGDAAMPRALSSAVGALLAPAAILLACRAWAQAPVLETRSQPIPAPQVSPEDRALSEAHLRLEEMKVDLALLADTATFPYYIGACSDDGELELRGLVPNETIKQRALDLAGRSTYLKVRDGLKISDAVSPPAVVRAPQVLQQEAAELLVKHFGEARRKIGLQARPNGQLMITGPIDSMETKLAVSRLFRQLPGCYGILNELIVEETLREGKRVVPVTNGSLMVPVASLESKNSTLSATPSAPRVEVAKPNPTPTVPQVKSESVAVSRAEQVRRPILPAPPSVGKAIPEGAWEAQHSLPPTSVVADRVASTPHEAKTEHTADAMTAPPLPKSWQRSAMTWESAPANTKTPATTPNPRSSDSIAQPIHIAQSVTPVNPASQSQTRPVEKTNGPISSYSAVDSSTHFQSSSPSMTWKRPSSSEESETKSNSTTASNTSPSAVRSPVVQPIQSSRRW